MASCRVTAPLLPRDCTVLRRTEIFLFYSSDLTQPACVCSRIEKKKWSCNNLKAMPMARPGASASEHEHVTLQYGRRAARAHGLRLPGPVACVVHRPWPGLGLDVDLGRRRPCPAAPVPTLAPLGMHGTLGWCRGELRLRPRPVDRFAGGLPVWNACFAGRP